MKEEEHEQTWEELVQLGLEARETLDDHQWRLGDLAKEVETVYGDNTIGKYAYAIGVMKKTLLTYKTVSLKFPDSIRKKYKRLSFSHFKTLASIELPEVWLEKADDDSWTVEHLAIEVKTAYSDMKDEGVPDPPPKVYRCPECNLWRLENISTKEICKGHYVIEKDQWQYK